MLSDLSDEEFAALRLNLWLAQESGEAKPRGEISYREIAQYFDTTPEDIRMTELTALEKLRNILHL